jgi:hypothetical protein
MNFRVTVTANIGGMLVLSNSTTIKVLPNPWYVLGNLSSAYTLQVKDLENFSL